ncbi:MAG: hypothetical protein GQ470_03355 [Gammaproteobacteria bacterium]|nr:hypothetical protein [Gammaproteobacteria bacterium]
MTATFEILLIQDDPVENQAISSILDDGFVNLIKYNIKSELDRCDLPSQHFDVAIIDIDTVSEDRPFYWTIFHQITHHNPLCLIMVITSNSSPEVINPLLEILGQNIVFKPYEGQDILHPINRKLSINFQEFKNRVDNEHQSINKLLTEIKQLIAIKALDVNVNRIFSQNVKQLTNLINHHFLLEERHMTLYRYPDLDIHQEEHKSLLDDLKMMFDTHDDHTKFVDEHLETINKIELKLDHDQHFMEFVSQLSYLNNLYSTS